MPSTPFKDQAAGLREWAGEHAEMSPAEEPPRSTPAACGDSTLASAQQRTLMVVGLPGGDTARVYRLLEEWRRMGQAWVGDAGAWRVVALDEDSPHLSTLATQQSRWALWVDSDPDAFRRSYRLLRRLAERGGPSGLLVLHSRPRSARGLLNNLRQAAAEFLGIRLLMVRHSEPPP